MIDITGILILKKILRTLHPVLLFSYYITFGLYMNRHLNKFQSHLTYHGVLFKFRFIKFFFRRKCKRLRRRWLQRQTTDKSNLRSNIDVNDFKNKKLYACYKFAIAIKKLYTNTQCRRCRGNWEILLFICKNLPDFQYQKV